MKHRVKVTVIDKKNYPELQQQYCADPNSGICSCYNIGDEFVFYRDDERDDFWHMGINTLVKTDGALNTIAGGPRMDQSTLLSIITDQTHRALWEVYAPFAGSMVH